MSVISGTEATYLLEARLDRAYTEELKQPIDLICSWHKAGAQEHTRNIAEELERASRKVGGYWRRVILLHQNNQLRPDFFAPGSPWLERSKNFRAAAEPLDVQLALQEPATLSWTPMDRQYLPQRPHTFQTLEELERQALRFAGEETLKRFIAKRKEALRLCDEDARQKFAALAKEARQHAHSKGEPLGPVRALSLREKFLAQAASPSKAPRVVTPAIGFPPAEAPAAKEPLPEEPVLAPTTPAQLAADILGLQTATTPTQAPAQNPPDRAALPDEILAQAASDAVLLQNLRAAAQTPVNTAGLGPAQASAIECTDPDTSAELADTIAAPSTLIRELAAGDGRRASSDDEADKPLSMLVAQLPASAMDISAPAQQALMQTSRQEPAHSEEPARDVQEGQASVQSSTFNGVHTADQADVAGEAKGDMTSTGEAAQQQAPPQSALAVPPVCPACTAATASEQAAGADQGKGTAHIVPEEANEVHSEGAENESAALEQTRTVRAKGEVPAQHTKLENPFFELKSFDPQLVQAAEQQRSMSLNPTTSADTPQKAQPLPDNPFFETRGPASSPDQLLKHATLYLLGGESPSATAADLGIIPMSRANTGSISLHPSVTAPAVAAAELAPKTPRQPAAPSDTLAPAKTALPPATSALPPALLAPVAEQVPVEDSPRADADISFPDSQPSVQPKPMAATASEGDPSSRQSSHDTSYGKSSDIYLPTWEGPQEPSVLAQNAVEAEGPAPEMSKGKDKVRDVTPSSSAPNSGHLPSWLPSTPGQSMEVLPNMALSRQGSLSGPMSNLGSNSWSAGLASKVSQLAEQLQRGNTINKVTAARRLQRLAASRSQVGDAVWEAEGVLPLAAMLGSKEPQEFDAAASAVAELANPDNKAFQIGVVESGGLKSLLTTLEEGNEAQSALAAKALASVIGGTPALQEVLLDADGAEILIRHLHVSDTPQAGPDAPQDGGLILKRQRSFKLAEPCATRACKTEEVAGAIAAFAGGFAAGQKAAIGAGGLPKLTHLLSSECPAVQDKVLSALLACTSKNAEHQSLLTEAEALPRLAQIARSAAAQPRDTAEDTEGGEGAVEPAHGMPPMATVLAQKALELLYSLASYFASHAALQADGCLEVLVAALASSDVTCAQYAVWAIQSLTAGNGRTEQGLCDAGAIQGLLGLIARCQEQPGEALEPARKPSRRHRVAAPTLRGLLEPAIVALSNLAAETASVKDDMRQAGAIDTCVHLLNAKGSTIPGHAARALWNLTSKNAANQDAAREAGAVSILVAMLGTVPKESKGRRVSKCEEAAGTVGSMAACNAPNQEAFRAAGALPLLLELVLSADRPIKEQAAWALHAMTTENDACMEDLVSSEAPAKLLPLLSRPELWNWTPVVSTMQNMSGGPQQAQHALVRGDAITVFLDILTFGRPTLQALSAAILGNLASGDDDAKKFFVEAGGVEKLQELSGPGSLASAPVRKAAARALTDVTKGKARQTAKRKFRLRTLAKDMLKSHLWCAHGLQR